MALPSTATAQRSTCPDVFLVSPSYACVDVADIGGEVVINPAGCSYVNGWSTSPVPGYAGLCTGAVSRGPNCSANSGNGGANTGACFEVRGADPRVNAALNTFPVGLVTASFICGNTNGEDPKSTSRDGCAIP